ncbi:MAG: hypothetical protein HYZ54_01235 [Ignavibacteriae bacterium]|nr:hypothetical protein [Ignavibacteriota bacterium]
MTPRLSKAFLTSHITFSVGWLGSVTVFLVLAITGLTSQDNQLARSSLIAMKLSAWLVIVPFCLTSLLTGVVQAVGTKWGLFKYYWIVVKLFLTVASTVLLLLHIQPISYLADVATDSSFSNLQHAGQIIDLIAKAGAAILVLLALTTISIYKPWGKIQLAQSSNIQLINPQGKMRTKKQWVTYMLIGLMCLLLIVIIKHLSEGGMHGH